MAEFPDGRGGLPPEPLGSLEDALRLLREVWGYAGLRPAQRRAIVAVLHRRDCLAVLPTGGGKSLCYQIPALLCGGLTLVVSPLISLMQDQVAGLRVRGLAAAYLSSTQRPERRRAVAEAVRRGEVRLLYLAPERLGRVRELLGGRRVVLLAVDEAHCISEWGHEFRPQYRRVGRWRQLLGWPPAIALTATATPETRADIVRVLGLRRPVLVQTSFDRPNLFFSARRVASERERFAALERSLRDLAGGSAIVYVPTRNRADGIARALRWRGIAAAPYHAGLPGAARRALLGRFLANELRVVVATTAFGMGIDQPDVRLVAHLGVPLRPEAYYQEAGRAGRDGRPARCEMLWREEDFAGLGPRAGGGPDRGLRAARLGLAVMRRYVSTSRCRRAVLLGYLGEQVSRCAGCDRCSSSQAPPLYFAP